MTIYDGRISHTGKPTHNESGYMNVYDDKQTYNDDPTKLGI